MVTTRVNSITEADGSAKAGIAYMCAGVFCLTINDAIVKWLGEIYPIDVIIFFRMLFVLPIIVAMGLVVGGRRALATEMPLLQAGRGLLAACATFSFVLGLTLLPLAENTAIAFASPLFITLIAIPLLGERPGVGQWTATFAGFGGVLLIVQPGTEAFTIGALAPLGAALFYALLMLTARMLGRRETIWATMLYTTLVPLVISAALLPWFWKPPALGHLPWLMAAGVFGGVAIALITQGFRVGVASVVAPFDYTGLVWAVAFGWMFWEEIPSNMAVYGILVIVVCGVYLAYTHTARASRRQAPEPLHPPRGE